MEWLVPILFVLASLAQWWMQKNRPKQDEEPPETSSGTGRPPEPRRQQTPPEEFGDLGDLLEALGRRRYESPPPPVEQPEPPVLPAPPIQATPPPRNELPPVSRPDPVIPLEPSKTTPVPAVVFPDPKLPPIAEPAAAFADSTTPRMAFRPFPAAEKLGTTMSHRWAVKLRRPESVREAIILSEILAPPVSLR